MEDLSSVPSSYVPSLNFRESAAHCPLSVWELSTGDLHFDGQRFPTLVQHEIGIKALKIRENGKNKDQGGKGSEWYVLSG